MVNKGFVKEMNQKMLIVSDTIEDLIYKMEHYSPPATDRVISEATT